jgi:predicted acetyltransferase
MVDSVLLKGRGLSGSVYEIAPTLFNMENLNNLRIIRNGKVIVSHVGMKYYSLNFLGQIFKVSLIGGVCTLDTCRGKGLASILLKDCIAKMEKDHVDISLLWTGSPDFYARLGWEEEGRQVKIVINAFNKSSGTDAEIYPFQGEYDELHDLRNHSEMCFLRRSFKDTLRNLSKKSGNILVAKKNAAVIAYVVYEIQNSTINVVEFFGESSAVASLLKNARIRESADSILLFSAVNDPRVRFLSESGWRSTFAEEPVGMWRIIQRDAFHEKLKTCTGRDDPGISDLKVFFEKNDHI